MIIVSLLIRSLLCFISFSFRLFFLSRHHLLFVKNNNRHLMEQTLIVSQFSLSPPVLFLQSEQSFIRVKSKNSYIKVTFSSRKMNEIHPPYLHREYFRVVRDYHLVKHPRLI